MNSPQKTNILTDVADYYAKKIRVYGETPQGVDWNGEERQTKRFEQLSKIIITNNFSINDLGCGYGALLDFLKTKEYKFTYLGIDVSNEMIMAGKQRNKNYNRARFITDSEPDEIADYGIASGIFNVKLTRSDSEWNDYLINSLDLLNNTSKLGFSFNCLTSYSDNDKKRDYLYYADPCFLFDLCKSKYSKQVALLHDYGLYELTILVRKV